MDMAKDPSFHDYVMHDLLATLPNITSRAMFGGWGIYKDDVIFGIIVDGELYFKVDDSNRGDFERSGSRPFVYSQGGKSVTMSYWLVPEEVMEDEEKLGMWVGRSVGVSIQSRKKK